MKKLIALLLSVLMLLTMLCACADTAVDDPVVTEDTTVSEPPVTTTEAPIAEEVIATPAPDELIKQMSIGWNLGNTLDAPDGENSWGQPTTTKEMIDKLKELGFNTIRVPVSWGKHVDKNRNIDKSWLDRVQEVVDYGIDNGMYVIINSHHDNDYYYPSKEKAKASGEYIKDIWYQVAERFKDYDYHLIFESMNEPRLAGTNNEWWFDTNSQTCRDSAAVLNELNQIFVDTVRATGGNNTDRYLSVPPYSASPYDALNQYFSMPKDSVENRLILSIHAYTPYDLVMGNGMDKVKFGQSEESSIDDFMIKIYNNYVKKGIPVYIGETGCINKNNADARYEWAYYFNTKALDLGMMICVWDNGNDATGTESYAFFDRRALKIFDNSMCVYNGFMDALGDAQ